jgi:capsular exopolysaccharide synthesis family protein
MDRAQYSQSLSTNGNGNGNGKLQQPQPQLYQSQFAENNQEELNLRHLLTVVRRRGLVIAGIAIAVTSVVSLWSFNRTPKYEGNFQLLVEPVTAENKLSKLTELTGMNPEIDTGMDYETQIQVLKSSELMSKLIDKLQTKYPDITYNDLIVKNKLKINRLRDTKILDISYSNTDKERIKFVLHEVAKGYLRYSFQERQANLNQGIKFVEGQLPKLQERVDKLQGQLQGFRQQNNLLDPQEQAKQLSERVSKIDQDQLESQVKLNETRTLYQTLQKQLGLAPNQALAAAALSESPRYQLLLNQLQELETKIATESARFTEASPTIQALRDQQRNLLPLLRQEAQQVLGNNVSSPPVSSASPNSIRLQLTQQMVDALNQIQVLEVRTGAIASAQSRLGREVKQLPAIARQYGDLQRELTVATESLTRFLGVRETLQIEVAQKALPWQLIARPKLADDPISPRPVRDSILGAIAGLLLGIGVALLLERLDNVFHSPDELRDTTKLPLLGIIPFQKQLKNQKPIVNLSGLMGQKGRNAEAPTSPLRNRDRQPQWYNSSPFLEAFRSLHTNISFLGSDTPIHSLVISSATPGDGKSTTSVQLAQAAAAMGKRVLLVDADMRRPQVHYVLGLPNHQGLSNVIATGLPPKQAIQRLPMWDHLYVLTAGPMPPDPTRLLSSKKMHYLMTQFQAVFDLVIYDTPPVLGLADGKLLATHTAGIVMVVGLGRTDRDIFLQALDGLKVSNATILGVVANGVKGYTTNSHYYYDHYYNNEESEVQKAKKLLQKRL